MSNICSEFDLYLKRLFPLCRSITGEANRETLRILQEIIPLTIHEIPTGTQVYNWVIPDEWTIYDAWISDSYGQRIVDFKANNLHVVSYSVPVRAQMTWSELKSHVHRHPELPKAIPYRTSYYNRDWGFCVTNEQYELLADAKESLTVVVDSELKSGSMSYGEYLIPGRSSREILLSCYICHPSMANDSLSGVLLTAFLARQIAAIKDLHWSYRVVFVPETIGSIAYCAINEAAMEAIDIGLVITTVGGPGSFSYKESFDPDHIINRLVENTLLETGSEYVKYPFDIHGSDERQYSSPGFRINCVSICKDKYYEYDEYHTSQDNLDFVRAEYLQQSYVLYHNLVRKIEMQKIYKRTEPHCEIMLSRHGLYPKFGGAQLPKNSVIRTEDIFLWLLYYTDGLTSIEKISNLTGFPADDIEAAYSQLLSHGLVEES